MKWNLATDSNRRTRGGDFLHWLIATVVVAALFSPLSLWGGENTIVWRIDKYKEGIKVSSRQIAGSAVRVVRTEVDINAPFDRVFALLLDASQRPRWDTVCAEASVHKQLSDSEDIIYIVNDLPWPVSDRDMVLRRQWSMTADGSQARIHASAENQLLPRVEGRVRVEKAEGVWTVLRTGASTVRVRAVLHAEPGGPIPSWLMNTLAVQGPYNAMAKLRQILESGMTSTTALSAMAGK